MAFLISMSLPFVVCLALVAVTSAAWWRDLRHPWLFAVVGLLAVLGVHRVIQVGAEVSKLFLGRGYFLEGRPTPSALQLAQEGLTVEAGAVSVLVAVFGFPVLLWLKRALPAL
jgi:hypothetical protein